MSEAPSHSGPCCASPLIMALYPALSASESHADPSHVGQELVVLALKYTA